MQKNPFDRPLSDDEFVELGELLAAMPEPFEPMEADHMDGYLTAIACLPVSAAPQPSGWMPFIFDAEGREDAALEDPRDQDRLEELIFRRWRMIDGRIRRQEPCDPIVYEIEDDRGHPVCGFDGIAAIAPFAAGFLEGMDRWPGLRESGDELVTSALLGILRHLPEELIGDLEEIRNDLDLESPLENLGQAIEDIAESVAEICTVTRGITKPAPRAAKRPMRGPKAPGARGPRGPQGGRGGFSGNGGRNGGFRR